MTNGDISILVNFGDMDWKRFINSPEYIDAIPYIEKLDEDLSTRIKDLRNLQLSVYSIAQIKLFPDDLIKKVYMRKVHNTLSPISYDTSLAEDQGFNEDIEKILKSTLKAFYVRLYSHWEGCIKYASQVYIDYLNSKKPPFESLNQGLQVRLYLSYLKVKDFNNSRSYNDLKKLHDLKYQDIDNSTLESRRKDWIKGETIPKQNLGYSNFEEILSSFGISPKKYDIFKSLINKLNGERNSLAHGVKELDLGYDSCMDLYEKITGEEIYGEINPVSRIANISACTNNTGLLKSFQNDIKLLLCMPPIFRVVQTHLKCIPEVDSGVYSIYPTNDTEDDAKGISYNRRVGFLVREVNNVKVYFKVSHRIYPTFLEYIKYKYIRKASNINTSVCAGVRKLSSGDYYLYFNISDKFILGNSGSSSVIKFFEDLGKLAQELHRENLIYYTAVYTHDTI